MSLEWDIEELAGYAMGKTEEEVEEMINNSTIEDELYEKYEVDSDTYIKIVKDLLPFTPVVKTALQGDVYNAFVTKDQKRMIARLLFKEGE